MAEIEVPPPGSIHHIAGGGAGVDRLLTGIQKRQRAALHDMPLAAARSAYAAAAAMLDIAPSPAVATRVESLDIHPHVQLRVHCSTSAVAGRRVLVWVHGGGFCLGSAASSDALCQWFAARLEAAVVSVEYRLTPEHRVQDAVADVAAAIAWVERQFPGLAVDVLGESAGATLALTAIASAADAGLAPVRSMVLCYPVVLANGNTPSRQRYASGHYLTVADIAWMHGHAGLDRDDTPLAPLLRPQWPAMPRTLFALAHRDPLYDEGHDLARRMRQAGTVVSEVHLPELIHGCLHMAGLLPVVRELHEHIAGFLTA